MSIYKYNQKVAIFCFHWILQSNVFSWMYLNILSLGPCIAKYIFYFNISPRGEIWIDCSYQCVSIVTLTGTLNSILLQKITKLFFKFSIKYISDFGNFVLFSYKTNTYYWLKGTKLVECLLYCMFIADILKIDILLFILNCKPVWS